MTTELTQSQMGVLYYLRNAPRANPDANPHNLTIWWFAPGPYISEFKLQTGLFFRTPAELTPQMIDALAAAGALAVTRSADIWKITLAPEADTSPTTAATTATAATTTTATTPASPDDWQAEFGRMFDSAETSPLPISTPPANDPAPDSPPSGGPLSGDPPSSDHATLVRLAQLIDDTFDREELQNLCFDLGIDYDNLIGERKETRARDLVRRMNKDGRLPELQATLARERPDQYGQKFGQ